MTTYAVLSLVLSRRSRPPPAQWYGSAMSSHTRRRNSLEPPPRAKHCLDLPASAFGVVQQSMSGAVRFTLLQMSHCLSRNVTQAKSLPHLRCYRRVGV